MKLTKFSTLMLMLLLAFAVQAADKNVVDVRVVQSRGADSAVNYERLLNHGPWDDRNYALQQADVALLPESDAKILDAIPAFYRVIVRKARPEYRGDITFYPRSAYNHFRNEFGGYLIDGKKYLSLTRDESGVYRIVANESRPKSEFEWKFLTGEQRITPPAGYAETAIAINPVNPNLLIAGANSAVPHQDMFRSTDGGETWSAPISLPDPNTCCDPTVGWSTDGTIGYTATLDACAGSGCSVKFYRSTNEGVSWTRTATLTSSGSDKEYIHVDSYSLSPNKDNIYLSWHDGNVQKFARSTDKGLTFGANLTIDAGNSGIGSDITSDKLGNVYYFFPSTSAQAIRVAKSTTAGASFAAGQTVAATLGNFDFPLPSMETRNAFIYTSAESDITSGPFGGSVYVAWTDNNNADSNTAANNHGRVRFAYSRDAGATWTTVDPVGTADVLTVDRYNQWLSVDRSGNLYLMYYNTKMAATRGAGVDIYATTSTDGGVTWAAEKRLTTVTSPNISDGFEWGDYNGMDALVSEVIAIFTDNRAESGSGESIDAYVVALDPPTPAVAVGIAPPAQSVCRGDALATITATATSVVGFAGNITWSLPGLNGTVFTGGVFAPNPIAVPADGANASTLTLSTLAGATHGTYPVTVRATSAAPAFDRDAIFNVNVSAPLVAAPNLLSPANGASGVSNPPALSWSAATNAVDYLVEIATDAAFNNIVVSQAVATTSFNGAAGLAPNATFFWRVTARNGCGNQVSAAFSFTTVNEICFNGSAAIPDNSAPGINNVLNGSAGTITDLNVRMEATHTWVGDLKFTLTHGATTVALIDRPGTVTTGGCQQNDIAVTADDEGADGTIESACSTTPPAVGGVRTPNAPLSAFDGQDFSGAWTLNVSDLAGIDTGNLTRWCLIPTTAAASTADVAIAVAGPANPTAGGAVTFTLTVTNLGPDAATGFSISDVLPATLSVGGVGCVLTGGGTCGSNTSAGQTVAFSGLGLDAVVGSNLVITINATLNAAATGTLSHSASVTGSGAYNDPQAGNNTAPYSAPITPDLLFGDSFEI